MTKPKILLVEDDPAVQLLTAAVLRFFYDVIPVASVAEAQAVLASKSPDLILLDLELPDEDGMVLARQIRARSALPPIIFVTSRSQTIHKIEGLNLGGDDYLTKPFDPDELVSRINAVLRRTTGQSALQTARQRIRIGYIEIDVASRQVWNAHGQPIQLTRAEFDVLLAITNANGRVLSRPTLLDAVSSSPDHDAGERTIDALVAKLRKKLSSQGSDRSDEQVIITVQGLGYRLGVVRS